MKIGIAVTTYYPEKDGVQFVTQNLAEGLVKNGHEITVITRLYKNCKKEDIINGVRVVRCNIEDKYLLHIGDKAEYQKKILEVAKSADAMVFVRLESVAADWVLKILPQMKCQKILYMHGMHRRKWKKIDFVGVKVFFHKLLKDIRWGIFYQVNQKRIGYFDKIIHLHEKDDSYIFLNARYPNKNYILANFAEDMFFEKLEERRTEKESKYFIYVANYLFRKNQMLLLKAFYLMKFDSKLIFVGNLHNQYYDSLIKTKEQLDIQYGVKKNIHFLYGIDRKTLSDLLQHAYAYVMTSKWEAFPITIIEAMASGIPFISTDVGVVKYLPGGMVVAENKYDIANAMDNLLDNNAYYQDLRKTAFEYACNHLTYKAYLSEFENILLKGTLESSN